jgi:hypothetical protein
MTRAALAFAAGGLLGWLVADALRESRHRYVPEDDHWNAAFQRILSAPARAVHHALPVSHPFERPV